MPVKVIMPQLGESVIEGTISKWLKRPGESINEFEPLLEVNTDKVDSEIASPASGQVLEILFPEGTTVQAGTLLAWIGQVGEALPVGSAESQPPQAAPAPEVPLKPSPPSQPVPPSLPAERDLGFISPVVRKIAREHNLNLALISGTGQSGRITRRDVLAYLDQQPSTPPAVQAPLSVPAQASLPASLPPVLAGSASMPLPGNILPLTSLRRAIADHMVSSKHTSPHVSTIMEVDLSRVAAHRDAHKASFARDGANLTYTVYFVAAAVAALRAYPIVNSSWSDAGIVIHPQINIGMATSLGEEGLIVPVIKNADSLSLLGLARTINDLASRARAKKLLPDEVKGGTFTITNHGISGSLFATPIINQPQCAILGVGMIQKRVVVVSDPVGGDSLAIRPMAYISLTFDHRILDGATADWFLAKVVESLRDWRQDA